MFERVMIVRMRGGRQKHGQSKTGEMSKDNQTVTQTPINLIYLDIQSSLHFHIFNTGMRINSFILSKYDYLLL